MAVMAPPGFVPWADEESRRYTEAGCWQGQPMGDLVWECADQYGEHTAIVDGARRISYLGLAQTVDVLAESILGLGLGAGNNILAQLPNSWEHIAFLLACLRVGVAPVQALLPHREHELGSLMELADVRAVATLGHWRGFSHQELATRLAAQRETSSLVLIFGGEVAPGNVDMREIVRSASGDPHLRRRRLDRLAPASRDIALFLLSGGSTGLPKLIARTHDDYWYNVRQTAEVCGFGPDTVYLAALPIAHNFALGCPGVLGTLACGGRVVVTPSPQPERAFALIEQERVTVTSLVPAVLRRWLSAAESPTADLSSLRLVQVGGSVMSAALARQVKPRLGGALQQVFGMAEGLIVCTRPGDPDDIVTTTQGRPVSRHDEIRIVGADGYPVPAGAAGELLARGPYTIRGYYAAPEHNARSFTEDGWYRTGDLVRMHPSGNLVVAGRVKDVINRGGEKIAADDVEFLVRGLPGVKDASAIGLPDVELGERVCVCVIPEAGSVHSLEVIRQSFKQRGVADFNAPEFLELFGSFPLTPIGKVDKAALRALAAARSMAASRHT